MRISDWSSDVCSSDLFAAGHRSEEGDIPAAVDADAGDCEVDVHDLGGAIDGDLQVCLVDDLEVVGENGRTGNCGAHVARGLFGDGHRSMPACGRPRGCRDGRGGEAAGSRPSPPHTTGCGPPSDSKTYPLGTTPR